MFKPATVILATFSLLLMACDGAIVSPEVDVSPAFARGGIHGEGMVPIKGNFVYFTDFTVTPVACGGGVMAGEVSGPGQASHLGETVFKFTTVTCSVDFGAATLTVFGPTTLTGANGDYISAESIGVFDLSELFAGTSPFGALTLTGEITDGTGRFAGATGSISATGVNDFRDGTGTFTLSGTISSVGSH